jgi:alpha-beta hydrolase superfamily lysophospholipase
MVGFLYIDAYAASVRTTATPAKRNIVAASEVWRNLMRAALAVLAVLATGCAGGRDDRAWPVGDVLVVVPGAGGYGHKYAEMVRGMSEGGVAAANVRVFRWGAALFVMNLEDEQIHEKAEAELVARLEAWRKRAGAGARVDLVGHSAGCGVILGALRRLPGEQRVGTLVLIAPSVSPTYSLVEALAHVEGHVHAFLSERDRLWLGWRAKTFGTYDRVRTEAAGKVGFAGVEALPVELRAKLVQHPYDPAWERLGNDGEHEDWLAPQFAREVLAPLLSDQGG